jgi:hypothetical protein
MVDAVRREVRDVKTGRVVGGVVVDGDTVRFDEYAATVLATLRRKMGDAALAKRVIADGWSDGHLYFAEPTP